MIAVDQVVFPMGSLKGAGGESDTTTGNTFAMNRNVKIKLPRFRLYNICGGPAPLVLSIHSNFSRGYGTRDIVQFTISPDE
jgi:hypothetical protein